MGSGTLVKRKKKTNIIERRMINMHSIKQYQQEYQDPPCLYWQNQPASLPSATPASN